VKIRTQLVVLLAGVALPFVLLSAFVTLQLWQQQRLAFQQQFLERASAVRLALDTEFDSTLRTLRAVGDAYEVPSAEADVVVSRRFRRVLDNYPDWAGVALTDREGRVVMASSRSATAALPTLELADVLRAMSSEAVFISPLKTGDQGQHFVFVAAAITRNGKPQGVVYAAIEHRHWLDLLRAYPVSRRGTLTLMDQQGTVITRTLNDPQWAGMKAPTAYWNRIADQSSGAFKTAGIDGTQFYAAFSRSAASGWVLATGVPQDEVDEALYWQTLLVVLVSVAALLGALLAAWRLSRNIDVSVLGLLATASALAQRAPLMPATVPIQEARRVQDALVDVHEQLLEREASLSASLEREALARVQAESGNRAKDQFLAMMGHELRNPLSAITAAADLLRNETGPRALLQRSRETVERQAGHLSAMISDLMDVAQFRSGDIVLHTKILDLAQVAAKVLARFEDTGRCEHLQMRTEHVPAWVEADEARVELLLTCLLDNACKYTPAGGTVTIEILGEQECSILRVRDTGAGFAPEVASSMFEPFMQGQRSIERAQGGLGLGLALARTLVDLHGGEIGAYSAGVGQGACFTVNFPRAERPLPAVAPVPSPPDLLLTIVEDIADNREMLQLLLESQGRQINAADDGPSGVQLILEGPSDAALVDIGLPGFDGLEVARRVRRAPAGQRVLLIALTGFGTEADRIRALDAGFDDFLVKPFDPARFEAALAKGLNSRHPDPSSKGATRSP
jgi:signal transduction histidine kinase/ActR/RegA family two-component response regulator